MPFLRSVFVILEASPESLPQCLGFATKVFVAVDIWLTTSITTCHYVYEHKTTPVSLIT